MIEIGILGPFLGCSFLTLIAFAWDCGNVEQEIVLLIQEKSDKNGILFMVGFVGNPNRCTVLNSFNGIT
jgi:hypothetical protein